MSVCLLPPGGRRRRSSRCEPLPQRRLELRGLHARAEKRAAKACIPYRRFSFHHLRHLFAVEYLREGKGGFYDLSRELGHSSVKTTEIYLAYLTPEQAARAQTGVAQKRAHRRRFGNTD
ncbi:site-specific integrase [Sphingomonas sp. ABOLG]|uniref:Site-specific integrase n=1 Tax=Sphingomonas olei TaxID=1886787 RepID=A0ABY2QG08_9SPHN|nr:site-specific integrase [Sphingomonas sp. ABOLG]THG39540.1 site-specific integrase [Sphingomonas olei]